MSKINVFSPEALNYVALFGAASALLVAWQARRTVTRGGAHYDREVYGMTAAMHKRVAIVAIVVAGCCFGAVAFPAFPATPFVAVETVAVILYLASFARGASYEDDL